jgi:Putative phage metallopeptidase
VAKKLKKTKLRVIEGKELQAVKALLNPAVKSWHPELSEARFALMWKISVEPDQDGRLELGKAKRASDCDRELSDHDLVIFLNREAWDDLKDEQRIALLDHELSHFAPVMDDGGNQKRDDRGRLCFRTVKHDLGEFRAVVRRHGCYLSDLELFARDLAEGRKAPLFATTEADQ